MGWARLGSPVDGGGRVRNPRSSRGSRVRLQLNPTRITPAPIMLPRLDALDADAIECSGFFFRGWWRILTILMQSLNLSTTSA